MTDVHGLGLPGTQIIGNCYKAGGDLECYILCLLDQMMIGKFSSPGLHNIIVYLFLVHLAHTCQTPSAFANGTVAYLSISAKKKKRAIRWLSESLKLFMLEGCASPWWSKKKVELKPFEFWAWYYLIYYYMCVDFFIRDIGPKQFHDQVG